MRRRVFAALACAAVLCMAVPAAAETFTTADGVLSIELPDGAWKIVTNAEKWFVVSDGTNQITADHYSNGEDLPAMSVANDKYANIYQAVYSTKNEVFVLTGSVADVNKTEEVREAVSSAKVLKYDTKTAVKKEQPAAAAAGGSEITVVDTSATMYTTTRVNVRAGWSTDDAVLDVMESGEPATVTGIVKKGGADYGWYRIQYNGAVGYVSASLLSSDATAGEDVVLTGVDMVIYKSDGTGITVYGAANTFWYDGNWNKYNWESDNVFVNLATGEELYVNRPVDQLYEPDGTPFTVFYIDGTTNTLTPYSNGQYYTPDWISYVINGDGTFSGTDGTVLYPYDPSIEEYDPGLDKDLAGDTKGIDKDAYKLTLYDAMTGTYLVEVSNDVSPDAYVWYDANGTPYQHNDDGTFTDYYGNSYVLEGTPIEWSNAPQEVFEHGLIEETTGTAVTVSNYIGWGEYVWYDANGTEYQHNSDGTFTDFYGNHYYMEW